MMGEPWYRRWILYSMKNTNIMMSNMFKDASVKGIGKLIDNSAGFMIITTESGTPEQLLKAGITLQHIWVEGTKHSIVMQPLSQMLLQSPWKDEISEKLETNGKPVYLILRIGYIKEVPPPVSERKTVSEILVK
ncbi:hypothetical protein D3C76_1179390 [compost metagenome]